MKVLDTGVCPICLSGGSVSVLQTEWDEYGKGTLIQVALKSSSDEVREQVISGTHPHCWALYMEYKDGDDA